MVESLRYCPPQRLYAEQSCYECFTEIARLQQEKISETFVYDRSDDREASLQAHLICLQRGYSGTHADRARAAREALAAFESCPEAYNILAKSEAADLQSALKYYRKAESLAASTINEEEPGYLWDSAGLGRAYFRAVHGVANTLRKLGRYAESLSKFLHLQQLENSWGTLRSSQGHRAPSYIVFHHHLAEVMILAGDVKSAHRLLTSSELEIIK